MKTFLRKNAKLFRVVISSALVIFALFLAFRSNILERFSEITAHLTLSIVASAFFLAVFTHLAAATRFYSIIVAANRDLRWFSVLRANVLGSVFGMVVVQMIGQMAGRQTILYRYGVTPATLSLATLIERFILAGVGGLGALLGTLFLIGLDGITAVSLPELIATPILIGLALFTSYTMFGSSIEKRLVDLALSAKSVAHIVAATLLTCVTWAITLLIFVLLTRTLHPEIGLLSAVAASAIISFAAAIPISVNGWGVREVTAVWILGTLGVPAADALIVSVGVGLLSTISIFVLLPLVGISRGDLRRGEENQSASSSQSPIPAAPKPVITSFAESATAWFLGIGIACLIFFQVTIGIDGTLATVSLADLLALAAFAFLLLRVLMRQPLPDLGSAIAYPLLVGVTGALVLALAIGAFRYGPMEWAIGNRTMGWMLLLGYFGAGAIIANIGGREGVNRVIQTMVITAVFVCITEIVFKLLPFNFIQAAGSNQVILGFYENRNAHAFLAIFGWILSIIVLGRKGYNFLNFMLVLGAAILIFFILGSRGRAAGLIILVAVPLAIIVFDGRRREIIFSFLLGVLLFLLWDFLPLYSALLLNWLQALFPGLGAGDLGINFSRLPVVLAHDYDNIRWALNEAAFAMWQQFPLFGAGLGAFMESQIADPINEFGPHVVHNTLLWLLAEFGLVGTAVVLSWFGFLAWQALVPKKTGWAEWQKALLLCLLVFGAYSLVHEIFYQRIFWFATGLLLALGAHEQSARDSARDAIGSGGQENQLAGPGARSIAPDDDSSTTKA